MSLSSKEFDELIKSYGLRRNAHELDALERKYAIYKLIPEYKHIDDQITDISIDKARSLIFSDSSDIDTNELKNRIVSLSNKKRELLINNGYPDDYLLPKYDCPLCKDTGYVDNIRCKCLKQAIIEKLYDQSNIRSILQKENFTFFTEQYYNDSEKPNMRKIVNDAKAFIANFDSTFSNLLFFGNVGCGKTFISNCIAKELLDSGHSIIYFTSYQLFEKFFGDQDLTDIFNSDLLIIDDLGSESPNSFTVSKLFLVLNERLQREKSTIISTNLNIQQLNDLYSERSISRILGSYNMYLFNGGDIRQRKKNTKHS